MDFDGTCVTHEFPQIGKDIGAVPVLKELVANGHKLILYTMRSDSKTAVSNDPDILGVSGKHLTEAIRWFEQNNIPLYGAQQNPTQKHWTSSPKCYAVMYIDDAALGCPLKIDEAISNRPFVDWEAVRKMLEYKGLI